MRFTTVRTVQSSGLGSGDSRILKSSFSNYQEAWIADSNAIPAPFSDFDTQCSSSVLGTPTMAKRLTLKQLGGASTVFDNQPNRFPKLNVDFDKQLRWHQSHHLADNHAQHQDISTQRGGCSTTQRTQVSDTRLGARINA
ncbi:hypothetical protein PIB30_014717 [Stylosanthes scabra]|uniref:Uncharacterized protein n=1 Tax=Stylosanthes scabra TaxID=79078 RepID=A0ABU6W8N4_9FABA|nr:hypothetical protein [Stylosanthes scabra]